ncbi:MAG: redoxin domain-containing protein [Ignavibacteriae bacterium]|nr:redoxin domain-containing protein [Ignavibacteriota bacterium]
MDRNARKVRVLLLTSIAAFLVLGTVAAIYVIKGGEDAPASPMVCETDSTSRTSRLFRSALPDLALSALDGTPVSIRSLAGPSLTVLVFASATCPCSDGYTGRLKELLDMYAPKGVGFAAIDANTDESIDQIKRYVTAKKYPLTMYRDELQAAADSMGATVTPEVFVFRPDWTLVYHGRIDDDKSGILVEERSLALALDTLLMGTALAASEKPARGCAIRR